MHFTFFSPAGHDLAMAQAHALHEPEDTGGTEAHPSVTQPPSLTGGGPQTCRAHFQTIPASGKVGKVLSPLYQGNSNFPTRSCQSTKRRTELIPPSNPCLLKEPFCYLISKEMPDAQTLLKKRQKIGLESLHAYVWSETGAPISLISSKLRQTPEFPVEFQSNDKYSNLIPGVKNAVNCALAFNASCLEEIYQPNLV